MSLPFAIAVNVIADLTLLGLLALVMTRAARLAPHGPGEQAANTSTTPVARSERHARSSAGRVVETLASRS